MAMTGLSSTPSRDGLNSISTFGSNSQLRAIAEVYGSADANDTFVRPGTALMADLPVHEPNVVSHNQRGGDGDELRRSVAGFEGQRRLVIAPLDQIGQGGSGLGR